MGSRKQIGQATGRAALGLFRKMGVDDLFRKVATKVDDTRYVVNQRQVNKLTGRPNANPHVGTGKGRRAKNKFPDRNGPPSGTLYRTDASGNVTYYAKYDSQGRIIKRVDFDRSSASHGGQKPPHTVEYTWHTGPNGQSSKTDGPTRPWNRREDL